MEAAAAFAAVAALTARAAVPAAHCSAAVQSNCFHYPLLRMLPLLLLQVVGYLPKCSFCEFHA
jgi:hypothetical protein